jgi:nucleotide-binding universal stress UspA family protein
MKPITHILAATDLSAPARHAVMRAFRIAAATGAQCTVLHALELDALDAVREWFGDEMTQLKQQLETRAEAGLGQLVAGASGAGNGAIAARIVHGAPLAAIVGEADRLAADLLVLGVRGDDYLRRLLLGSTASRILRKATGHPVLVVKEPPHEDYRRVLVPVDFSPASRGAVDYARRAAPGADLVLFHAYEVPFEGKLTYAGVESSVIERYRLAARNDALGRMRQLADAAGLAPGDYTPCIVHGDASQQIVAQEQELDRDLIVIGKHGVHVTEELLLGSVTHHVLDESQCDVLVICGRSTRNDQR